MGRTSIILILIVALGCSSFLCCRAYGDDWTFAVIGDTRGADTTTTTGVSTYLPAIASVIANPSLVTPGTTRPSAVFVSGDLINGNDLLDPVTLQPDYRIPYSQQFVNWKSTTYGMGAIYDAGIPIYTVRGNHENNADDALAGDPNLKAAYYTAFGDPTQGSILPRNGPNNGPNDNEVGYTWNMSTLSAFNQKYVRIISIDQYFYYNSTQQGMSNYYKIDQTWLNQQLSKTAPARYTFVMAHEPVFYLNESLGDFYGTINSDGTQNAQGIADRTIFWNALGANGVKMYLCSHVHNVEVGTAPYGIGVNTIYQNMTGNGGAPFEAQSVDTDPNLTINHDFDDFSNYGFALYTVTDDSITVNYYQYNPVTLAWSLSPFSINFLANPVNTWITTSGNFSDPANWDVGAVPGAGDTAVFNSGASTLSTVNFTADAVNDKLFVASGRTTFNLNGQTYTATTSTAIDGTENTTYQPYLAVTGNGSKLVTGALTMDAGATLSVGQGASVQCATLDIGSTSINTITGNGTTVVTGALTTDAGATLSVGQGTPVQCATLTVGANGILMPQAGSATSYGQITSTGAATIPASAGVILDVQGYLPTGSQFIVVDGTGGTGVKGGIVASATSPVFTVTSNPVDSEDLTLTVTRSHPYNQLASNGNTSAVGTVLEAIGRSGATGDMLTVLNALDSLTSAGEVNTALNTLIPVVDNSVPQVSRGSLESYLGTITGHLEQTRLAGTSNNTGISSGDEPADNGIWSQGFGTLLHQDPQGTSNGYDANIWGTALGYDKLITDALRLGASFGYANDSISPKDNSGHTDADSYQGTLYADCAKAEDYISGAFSFAYNDYSSSRNIFVGGISRTANSDYAGQQYGAYLEGGHTFRVARFELTPLASLAYQHLHTEGYTETNAGDLNLKVDSQGYNLLESGLGAKVAYPLNINHGTFIPEFHVKWLYDIVNDNAQATSTFTGGGASFATTGFKPARSSANIGAKFILITKQDVELSLNYDFQTKEDFNGHSVLMNVRYTF